MTGTTTATMHHSKSDWEVTSFDQSTPPRSPRRPLYYVQSPSNHDAEKMSYGSSPAGSPQHHHNQHYYHCSPIHHSRESSATRFSASLKNPRSLSAWRKIAHRPDAAGCDAGDDSDSDAGEFLSGPARTVRLYLCFALGFLFLFSLFSLILWAASKSYHPIVSVQVRLSLPNSTQLFLIRGVNCFYSFSTGLLISH